MQTSINIKDHWLEHNNNMRWNLNTCIIKMKAITQTAERNKWIQSVLKSYHCLGNGKATNLY